MALDRRQLGTYMPLRDAIDRLFTGSVIAPEIMGGGSGFPPADITVTDNDVIVCLAVPGATPDDINVNVTGDTLTISGEVKHEWHSGQRGSAQSAQKSQGQTDGSNGGQKQPQTYLEEIWHGRFQRSFTLPTEVQADGASADFENGVLRVTLPKSEATKPRTIPVRQQSKQGQQSKQESQQNVAVQSGSSS